MNCVTAVDPLLLLHTISKMWLALWDLKKWCNNLITYYLEIVQATFGIFSWPLGCKCNTSSSTPIIKTLANICCMTDLKYLPSSHRFSRKSFVMVRWEPYIYVSIFVQYRKKSFKLTIASLNKSISSDLTTHPVSTLGSKVLSWVNNISVIPMSLFFTDHNHFKLLIYPLHLNIF